MPLAYFNLDDLKVSLEAVAFAMFIAGFSGAMVFHLLHEIAAAVGSIVRDTRWYNRREAAMFWKMAHNETLLARFPFGQREKQRQRWLARCAKHAEKAEAIEDLARYRSALRKGLKWPAPGVSSPFPPLDA